VAAPLWIQMQADSGSREMTRAVQPLDSEADLESACLEFPDRASRMRVSRAARMGRPAVLPVRGISSMEVAAGPRWIQMQVDSGLAGMTQAARILEWLARPVFPDRVSRTEAWQAAHLVPGELVAVFRAEQAVAQAPGLVQETVELACTVPVCPVEQALPQGLDLAPETVESPVRGQERRAAKPSPAPAEGVGRPRCVHPTHRDRTHPVAGRVPLRAFERLDLPAAAPALWPWKQG
jgi:hypothetical protein